jgi:hypothetical protein
VHGPENQNEFEISAMFEELKQLIEQRLNGAPGRAGPYMFSMCVFNPSESIFSVISSHGDPIMSAAMFSAAIENISNISNEDIETIRNTVVEPKQ